MADKTGIEKIQFRRFHEPFKEIVRIWPEKKDNAEHPKDIDPLFGLFLRDFSLLCHGGKIYKLLGPRGQNLRESMKFQDIDAFEDALDIALNVRGDITAIKEVPRSSLYHRRHRASENHFV